jgi:hypothetical protein
MNQDKGKILLTLARNAIASQLGISHSEDIDAVDWLQQNGASFVTLTKNNELRGCIGSLQSYQTLADDVRSNAIAAAFHDTRFAPLSRDEYNQIKVEVSVLSPMQTVDFVSQADLLAKLRPNIDGVVMEYAGHRGTFLPQVWEQIPDKQSFLNQLKLKAGLPIDFWDNGIKVERYQVSKYHE